ncbi:MAG: phosphatidylserine decarboxylase [Treponema sp.]|nr:phosphatidylserine decarboxylase [Treponema sp.]
MRIPLTRYGVPQVVVFPLIVVVLMVALCAFFWGALWLVPVQALLLAVLIWMFSFFRDPKRIVVQDETILYSPADGTITDIGEVDGTELGTKALRIGMFLSVFNVHINRAPCSVRVENVTYKKGRFINAMSLESSRVNEANDVLMTRVAAPCDKLLVRQISGAIARHIVCEAKVGSEYRQGETFGMIKFGSRAELYLPAADVSGGTHRAFEVAVKIGDPVRAGLTPLVKYLGGKE